MKKKNHTKELARSKSAYKCVDGPFKGATLWLDQLGTTLPLTIKGQTGRYIGGRWNAISQY